MNWQRIWGTGCIEVPASERTHVELGRFIVESQIRGKDLSQMDL